MRVGKVLRWIAAMAGLVGLVAIVPAVADINVQLKDGSVVKVPVNKEDVVSISFEDSASGGSDGMTWDFETGDLRGWTASGDAFTYQPTFGDNPTARNRGQASKHEGEYWVGGYEKRPSPTDPAGQIQGDGPQGTLISQSFTIKMPTISLLVGGGCDPNTVYVELVVDKQSVIKTTGKCTETMERAFWSVKPFMGRTAQIRIVDASSGGWGHINVDDVRFLAAVTK